MAKDYAREALSYYLAAPAMLPFWWLALRFHYRRFQCRSAMKLNVLGAALWTIGLLMTGATWSLVAAGDDRAIGVYMCAVVAKFGGMLVMVAGALVYRYFKTGAAWPKLTLKRSASPR